MMQPQRQQHLTKYAAASLSDTSFVSSSSSLSVGRDISAPSVLSVSLETFAGSVRVPCSCLDGIWSKASEFLRKENAIVPAPGIGEDAKCVQSYRGKKPHLVLPKKSGQFSCDSDCPNFKALGICSHVVPVTETCKKLPDLVASFIKTNPNQICRGYNA